MLTETPKLLLIRNDNIGDLICSIPAIQLIRSRFPNSEITLLVNSYNAPVVECLVPKWVNRLLVYHKTKHAGLHPRQLLRLIRFYVNLWKERSPIAVMLVGGTSRQALTFSRWSGARRLIGYDSSAEGPPFRDDLHEVEYSWRLAAYLCKVDLPPPDRIDYPHRATGDRIAIQITSRKPGNRWDASNFAELARALYVHTGQRPILLWSPGDSQTATHPGDDAKASDILETSADILDPHPTSTLNQLISVLKTCRYLVTPDGGAMHLAAAMGIRIVCLFGQSAPSRWRPWTPHARVLQSPSHSVQDISPIDVLNNFKMVETLL